MEMPATGYCWKVMLKHTISGKVYKVLCSKNDFFTGFITTIKKTCIVWINTIFIGIDDIFVGLNCYGVRFFG
ncbi:hypothetical protein D3C81_1402390 [compost metagenome]